MYGLNTVSPVNTSYAIIVSGDKGKKTDVWTFSIQECFLCESETLGVIVKVKPPTATARLLSIDGGGVRGIIPLIILQALEERIGLPYPVYGNFDFIFGTSAG